jgi:hypothetical protein
MTLVARLNAEGCMATLDVLGEDVTRREETEQTVRDYEQALSAIAQRGLDSNISVKLTALGLKLDPADCRLQLARIVAAARATQNRAHRHGGLLGHGGNDRIFLEFRANDPKVGLVLSRTCAAAPRTRSAPPRSRPTSASARAST